MLDIQVVLTVKRGTLFTTVDNNIDLEVEEFTWINKHEEKGKY